MNTPRTSAAMRVIATLLVLACRRERSTPGAAAPPAPAESQAAALGGAIDASATRVFWTCLFGKDVEIAQIANGQQVRSLVASAYEAAKATFPERVVSACVPALERAQRAFAALPRAPGSEPYADSLAK